MSGDSAIPVEQARLRWFPWITVAMLFAVQTISRADKAVLGLAAGAIMTELSLSPERYGLIASSFYFLYGIGGIAVGYFLGHRYRPRIILAGMIAVWSLSQLPIILAASFATLLVGRIVLGLAEGGTPTCVNACHEWFPSEKRNLPTSIVMFGAILGSLASAPVLSAIITRLGWRAAFISCAVAGGIILVMWVLFSRDGPYSGIGARDAHGKAVSGAKALRMLRDRSIYGSFIMMFSTEWVTGFTLTWLPIFCTKALGFSLVETGWLLSMMFLGQGLVMLAISALSQVLIQFGISTRIARASLNAVCLMIGAVCLVSATHLTNPYLRLIAVGLGVGFPIVTVTLNPALLSEIFPPRHRNRLVHMILAAGTIGAMMAPWLTGKLVGTAMVGNWSTILLINATILTVAGVLALMLIDPARSARRLREIDELAD